MDGGGRDTTVKRCRRGVRLREPQHAAKEMKGGEMGDDIVEMTVWGQGAEESGKTGCTGCMKARGSEFHLGSHADDLSETIYLHFASGIKAFYFTKTG